MSHYYDKEDAAYRSQMAKAAPKEFQAFVGLMRVVGIEDGAIPRKYRELIAIAVAHATGCVYCIEAHVKEAKKIDVSKEELSEAIMIRSEEHKSELQSLMRTSYAVFCLKKTKSNYYAITY